MIDDDSHESAFTELFDSFYSELLNVAWHICGHEDVAEELCQEAFLRYYERRKHLPKGIEARYWLIRVLKNLAYSHGKRLGREREVYQTYQPGENTRNEGEETVMAEESRRLIRKSLAEIPYKLRIVLVLKEYTGYSYATIAKILRITENNVKIRVYRARKHLSRLLEREDLYVP